MLLMPSADFFNFLIFFHVLYQSVNRFGSSSGLKFCRSSSKSKLFAKVIMC